MGKEDPTLIGSSTGSNKKKSLTPNYARRREQVRRAQKKHRDQKEKRCRMLEDEVHKLYGQLMNARELRDLHRENEILKDIVSRHSIPLPSGVHSRKFPLARVTIVGENGANQYLQVQMPDDMDQSYRSADQDSMLRTEDGIDQDSQLQYDELYEYPETRPPQIASSPEITQLGVDFVLSLERPCLFHTQSLSAEEPSGHAMSMQGLLLSDGPSGLNNLASWEVPAQQLDKLFELSGSLGLDGYITPVQAWNRICHRCNIGKLPKGRLDMLRSAMAPHIQCYGFGARMNEQVFEDLLCTILQ